MGISPALSAPRLIPGPLIHGLKTTASIFSVPQLVQSPFLPSLLSTINQAFAASHSLRPELFLQSHGPRLSSIEDFLSNLQDPDSSIIIVSRPGSDEVIATSSARRYIGPPVKDLAAVEVKKSPWTRTIEVEPGAEEWELKLMATQPDVQGQGVAAWMMALVEREIVARSQAKWAAREGEAAVPRLKMVLCTLRELKGEFYLRRGYVKDYETSRGDGFQFHILHLSKTIET
ncbi:unnamed protein product [Zymoseptoria tritici ST99CH_1E4]|uniref:N-acetyltransferase domain-containing protein n=1 Tax=Zymoseptoria tritici ST99CH_1E4 TaxID=1276532 RepID=A0A2H1H7Q6_ZYMTR|nr:unnamed protein product [Zymoseptoria tritici ST99CH_1E4]